MPDPTLETADLPALYEHKKRKEWGLAILAWEQSHKRGYLFEDGEVRIVADGFYKLMEEVDRPQDEAAAIYERLRADLAADAGSATTSPSSVLTRSDVTFEDQVDCFRSEFAEGFQDSEWQKSIRGADESKRLKRHRDAAISDAQARLDVKELDTHIGEEQFRAVWEAVVGALDATDLVPVAQLKLKNLDDVSPEDQRALASAVREMLYGEGVFDARFDRFLRTFESTFGEAPGWQLASCIPALVQPGDHICIRPSSFREQAKWMAPRLSVSKAPTASSYARLLGMAKLVRDKLTDQGYEPQDFMDVHDFIRLTTRPAARQAISTKKAQAQRMNAKSAADAA